MKRLAILFTVGMLALLTACDTQTDRTKAEAARLSAQAQAQLADAARTRAESDAATARALVNVNNARADDLQLIVWAAVVLAALSMSLSVAMAFMLHQVARTPAHIVYQIMSPPPAQLDERYQWPEERARRRAMAQIEERRTI